MRVRHCKYPLVVVVVVGVVVVTVRNYFFMISVPI